jgi:hypothetical protein
LCGKISRHTRRVCLRPNPGNERRTGKFHSVWLAEGVRFELTRERNPLPVFKTGALNHSATLPTLQKQGLSDNLIANILATSVFLGQSWANLRKSLLRLTELGQRRVDRIGGFVVAQAEQVRINLQRDIGRLVPQAPGDRHHVDVHINQLASVGVP